MRWSLIAAIVLYGWTVFGILSSAHFFLGEEARNGSASLEDIAAHVLLFYWAWAAVTPFVLLALRRAVDRESSARWRLALVLGATPAIVVAHALLYLIAVRIFGLEAVSAIGVDELRDYAMRHAGGDVATVGVLVALYMLLDAWRRAHAREVAATELEARLAYAGLEVLRSQLQPHFLFNALNTVSTLVIKGDTAGAENAIGQISRYLRTALVRRADATASVGDEIVDVEQYFRIERLRFGDALRLDVMVGTGARDARVPALLLQPLVENAIRHGLAPASDGARIELTAIVEGARLRLRVVDPGSGSAGKMCEADGARGFGLRYVRERLVHFYGDDATLDLATTPAGTVVTVDMPLAPQRLRAV